MTHSNYRKNMPSKQKIINYWLLGNGHVEFSKRGIELSVLSNNDYNCCFACGDILQIERSHIKAKSEGGSDTVENLHLLCKKCHLTSELLSGNIYWDWLENMNKNHFKLPGQHTLERLQQKGFDINKFCSMILENRIEESYNFLYQYLPIPYERFITNIIGVFNRLNI